MFRNHLTPVLSFALGLRFALTLVFLWSTEAASQPIDQIQTLNDDSASHLMLHNGAQWTTNSSGTLLSLPQRAYAAWTPGTQFVSESGSLIMWITPLWQRGDPHPHTFATFHWSGDDQSYFALAQGWWQPGDIPRMTAVLSNQDHLACEMPWNFDYTYFLPNQATMLGVTWHAGQHGYVRLFIDGHLVCESSGNLPGGRHSQGPLFVGSDLGTPVADAERRSDMVLNRAQIVPRSMSGAEMRRIYSQRAGNQDLKWIRAIVGADAVPPVSPERRIIQDEDTSWASSRSEIRRRIERIKAAGFNVYMPNVWNGGAAFYVSHNTGVSSSVRDPADPGYDPLAYLIDVAHRAGIAVHPWFIIVRHPLGSEFPQSYLAGAPKDAFNVQSADFRDFAVALVDEVAARYDVDGINLDYIQSMGVCSNQPCVHAYEKKYRRSLADDWQAQLRGENVVSLIEWNTSAVSDIVERISAGVRKSKPRAILSIDVTPLDHGTRHEGLDEGRLLKNGTIDALIDMAYDDPIDVDGIDRAVRAYSPSRIVVNVRNYDLYDDTWANRSGEVMSDYVALIRKRWPGTAVGFYQYPHLDARQSEGLHARVFFTADAADWHRAPP